MATCEGCKGFFKRSTMRGEKYKCFFGGQCEITPQNRNRCKSCRFRLCLESGMSLEAVKMGRIPKLEKERALELASQEGSHGIENFITDETATGQKKSIKKGVKREHKFTSGFSSFPDQEKLSHDESARMSSSFDSKPESLEIDFDVDKSRMIQPRQSISSVDSSTDSQSLDYLGKRVCSPESSSEWGPHPHGPVPALPYNDISSFTSSLLSESSQVTGPNRVQKMEDMDKNLTLKTEYGSQFENCLHKNPSGSSSFTSPPILEGCHAQNCPPTSIHSNKFFHLNYPSGINTGVGKQEEMSTLDYETDLHEKLYPKYQEACNVSHYDSKSTASADGASRDSHICISSSSSESTIWDKEILVKLQVNDDSFKTELEASEIFAPVRNHYPYLVDVEQGGMFNRLPLYIQTLQQLDVCQRTGLLLKLQEIPNDMIDKICKMLAMEDRFAVSKEGVSMGKDSTFLIQGTLQRLKFSMDTLWKPIWLLRQYIRQVLSSTPGTVRYSGVTAEDLNYVWPSLIQSVQFYNDVIIGFAFGCPGFKNLQSELKEILTQNAYFEIWILLMADFCIDGKCHFPLPNKVIYTNETMIKILKEKSVVEIKGVLEKINKCQLCDLEIGLLCATLLIDPDDEKLANSTMNLEPLRALHSHYLDILATVVTKIHTTQSNKKLSDIFSLTPLIKKVATLLQLQVTQYAVEQIPDEDCLQSIAMNAQANVEKEHLL